MQLHDILEKTTKRKKRVGRGGKRGKTSGRGTKGQKARAGRNIRPAIRDRIKKIPKKRGIKFNPPTPHRIEVQIGTLEKHFKEGEKVTPRTLKKKGLISIPTAESDVLVKVLNRGTLTKRLILENIQASRGAAEQIFAHDGEIRNVE